MRCRLPNKHNLHHRSQAAQPNKRVHEDAALFFFLRGEDAAPWSLAQPVSLMQEPIRPKRSHDGQNQKRASLRVHTKPSSVGRGTSHILEQVALKIATKRSKFKSRQIIS